MANNPLGIKLPPGIQKLIDEHHDSLICDEDDLDYWLGGADTHFNPGIPIKPRVGSIKYYGPDSEPALQAWNGDPSVPITGYDINDDNDPRRNCLRGQHERVDVGFTHSKWVCKHCDVVLIEGKDF